MKISELKFGEGNVELSATIRELEEEKSFSKFGREIKLRNATIEDDSGAVKLTLWNEDVNRFEAGDKIKITNGYVKEFQGEKQLTAGKFGKIEKVEEEAKPEEEAPAEEPAAGEEKPAEKGKLKPEVPEEKETEEEIEEGLEEPKKEEKKPEAAEEKKEGEI